MRKIPLLQGWQFYSQFSLPYYRIVRRILVAKSAIDKSPAQPPPIHRKRAYHVIFWKIPKNSDKKTAKKNKKLRFWHLAFSSGYSTKMMQNVMRKSPYLCLLCIFLGMKKCHLGLRQSKKTRKTSKQKRTLDAHRNQYTFPYSKNYFENSKKNFKKTYELENKTENLKFDSRPLASPRRRRRSHLSVGNG